MVDVPASREPERVEGNAKSTGTECSIARLSERERKGYKSGVT